ARRLDLVPVLRPGRLCLVALTLDRLARVQHVVHDLATLGRRARVAVLVVRPPRRRGLVVADEPVDRVDHVRRRAALPRPARPARGRGEQARRPHIAPQAQADPLGPVRPRANERNRRSLVLSHGRPRRRRLFIDLDPATFPPSPLAPHLVHQDGPRRPRHRRHPRGLLARRHPPADRDGRTARSSRPVPAARGQVGRQPAHAPHRHLPDRARVPSPAAGDGAEPRAAPHRDGPVGALGALGDERRDGNGRARRVPAPPCRAVPDDGAQEVEHVDAQHGDPAPERGRRTSSPAPAGRPLLGLVRARLAGALDPLEPHLFVVRAPVDLLQHVVARLVRVDPGLEPGEPVLVVGALARHAQHALARLALLDDVVVGRVVVRGQLVQVERRHVIDRALGHRHGLVVAPRLGSAAPRRRRSALDRQRAPVRGRRAARARRARARSGPRARARGRPACVEATRRSRCAGAARRRLGRREGPRRPHLVGGLCERARGPRAAAHGRAVARSSRRCGPAPAAAAVRPGGELGPGGGVAQVWEGGRQGLAHEENQPRDSQGEVDAGARARAGHFVVQLSYLAWSNVFILD
ncbi:uncharacterized protein RHOBADRAFT_51664, partial [Rhodotorula graminis WP1]